MIHPLHRLPDDIDQLVAVSEAEGMRMVRRFAEEWRSGHHRFCGPGERIFAATLEGRTVAIGGLSRDPFVDDETVGRVRRMYVHPDHRGQGMGSSLLDRIVRASGFARLRIRTDQPNAAAFYEARGFEPVGDANATHELAKLSG